VLYDFNLIKASPEEFVIAQFGLTEKRLVNALRYSFLAQCVGRHIELFNVGRKQVRIKTLRSPLDLYVNKIKPTVELVKIQSQLLG
jgi:hypothetical protein